MNNKLIEPIYANLFVLEATSVDNKIIDRHFVESTTAYELDNNMLHIYVDVNQGSLMGLIENGLGIKRIIVMLHNKNGDVLVKITGGVKEAMFGGFGGGRNASEKLELEFIYKFLWLELSEYHLDAIKNTTLVSEF